jgi:hypothetical protein
VNAPSLSDFWPAEWTDEVAHKYCGTLDAGRAGKPNKVHLCGKWYVGHPHFGLLVGLLERRKKLFAYGAGQHGH